MNIKKIFSGIDYQVLQSCDTEIFSKNMEYDSRKIVEGDIFVALEGNVVDGHDYIDKAIELGAKVIIVSKKVPMKKHINYFLVENLRKNLPFIASNFYDFPQDKLKIIGVTGTNGKTTTTYMLETILGNENIARIGTVEYKIGEEIIVASNTTPESLDLVKFCKKAVDKKIKYLIMEVSSHGLSIGRVDMLKFDVGIFTNLTPEHLDYHKTMENYYLAKRKMFDLLKNKNNSVINEDDDYGKKYLQYTKGMSYGLKNSSITGNIKNISRHGQDVIINILGSEYNVTLNILGRYNLYNLLGAVGCAKLLGLSDNEIIKKISKIKGAPGRFENVNTNSNFTAIVDYAHTGDALENILKSINEFKINRVITVFGCGGDRDKTKRPIMGRIAEKNSDIIIVTSDNPRTENPEEIVKDIVVGLKEENHIIEVDREKAIFKAIELAKKDDIILVAGKGHENYQVLGRKKIHFDDREKIIEGIEKLKK